MRGIGRLLVEKAELVLREEGVEEVFVLNVQIAVTCIQNILIGLNVHILKL